MCERETLQHCKAFLLGQFASCRGDCPAFALLFPWLLRVCGTQLYRNDQQGEKETLNQLNKRNNSLRLAQLYSAFQTAVKGAKTSATSQNLRLDHYVHCQEVRLK